MLSYLHLCSTTDNLIFNAETYPKYAKEPNRKESQHLVNLYILVSCTCIKLFIFYNFNIKILDNGNDPSVLTPYSECSDKKAENQDAVRG